MERVIANDESVIGEGSQEHRLFAWDNAERFLDRFDARNQVSVGASAADSCEELRNRRYGLALHGVRVETLEFFDSELNFLHLSVFDKHIEPGRALDFGKLFDAELAEFGYLVHRIKLTTYNGGGKF